MKPKRTLLAYGDSITQGYDAVRPSGRYASRLADMLGAEEINKGIGGEQFVPTLAALGGDLSPDYITVAYGTNDWSHTDYETFMCKCRGFYTNLALKYKDVPIFAVTPIWRADLRETRPFGNFDGIAAAIKEAVKELKNVTVIEGIDLVPENTSLFGDFRLHPNDKGFEHYASNLYAKIEKHL